MRRISPIEPAKISGKLSLEFPSSYQFKMGQPLSWDSIAFVPIIFRLKVSNYQLVAFRYCFLFLSVP